METSIVCCIVCKIERIMVLLKLLKPFVENRAELKTRKVALLLEKTRLTEIQPTQHETLFAAIDTCSTIDTEIAQLRKLYSNNPSIRVIVDSFYAESNEKCARDFLLDILQKLNEGRRLKEKNLTFLCFYSWKYKQEK